MDPPLGGGLAVDPPLGARWTLLGACGPGGPSPGASKNKRKQLEIAIFLRFFAVLLKLGVSISFFQNALHPSLDEKKNVSDPAKNLKKPKENDDFVEVVCFFWLGSGRFGGVWTNAF